MMVVQSVVTLSSLLSQQASYLQSYEANDIDQQLASVSSLDVPR